MNIPSKIKKGDQFSSKIIDAINGIIDYLESTRPVQGDGIRLQHTATGIIVNSTAKANITSSIDSIPYYNDFTIIDLSEYDSEGKISNLSVAVAHGWTWNPEKKYSRSSVVYINDHLFFVSSQIFENLSISGTHYLYVHENNNLLVVECGRKLPASTFSDFYYEIGQIVEGQIIQKHKSGPLFLYSHWKNSYF